MSIFWQISSLHITGQICVPSCWKKLDFSQLWIWKRGVRFFLHKVIVFRQKKKSVLEIPNCIRCISDQVTNQKFQKSNIIFEGFRHPIFMNPFENGKKIGLTFCNFPPFLAVISLCMQSISWRWSFAKGMRSQTGWSPRNRPISEPCNGGVHFLWLHLWSYLWWEKFCKHSIYEQLLIWSFSKSFRISKRKYLKLGIRIFFCINWNVFLSVWRCILRDRKILDSIISIRTLAVAMER